MIQVPSPAEGGAGAVDPAEAELADYLDAVDAGRSRVIPLAMVAGRIAESLPAGPELAGWIAAGPVTDLEDGALAGMAASCRRLASWAQSGELAVVAELAARSAAADDRIGVDEQGRPARLPDDTCAEVSLALTMSQCSASWWSDLAVTLRWRLPATGAALRSGTIDLGRARLIAEATAALGDPAARSGQDRVDHRSAAGRAAPRGDRGRPSGRGAAPRGSRKASTGGVVPRRGGNRFAGRVQPARNTSGSRHGPDQRTGTRP